MKFIATIFLAGMSAGFAFAQTPTPEASPDGSKKDYSNLTFKLFEQSKPKPMGAIPAGWKLTVIEGQKTEHPPIKLPNGKEATAKSAAYVIVPESGKYILDPCFDVTKGNAQSDTIGAVLTQYAEQNKKLETKLDTLVEALQAALADTNEPEVKKATAKTISKKP
jgi:hypothetical protein